MSQMHTIEELNKMTNWQIDAVIAKDIEGWKEAFGHNGMGIPPNGGISNLPRYCASRNTIIDAVREWCGEDEQRQEAFLETLVDVVDPNILTRMGNPIPGMHQLLTAPARDMSIALVLAAEKGAE